MKLDVIPASSAEQCSISDAARLSLSAMTMPHQHAERLPADVERATLPTSRETNSSDRRTLTYAEAAAIGNMSTVASAGAGSAVQGNAPIAQAGNRGSSCALREQTMPAAEGEGNTPPGTVGLLSKGAGDAMRSSSFQEAKQAPTRQEERELFMVQAREELFVKTRSLWSVFNRTEWLRSRRCIEWAGLFRSN